MAAALASSAWHQTIGAASILRCAVRGKQRGSMAS